MAQDMSAPQLTFTENCEYIQCSVQHPGVGWEAQRIKGFSWACTRKASSLTFGICWVDSKCLLSHRALEKPNTEWHSEDLRNHLGRQGDVVWNSLVGCEESEEQGACC